MSADSWEERMAARARARGAAGQRLPDGRPLDDAPYGLRHDGHTQHMHMNEHRCSCGKMLGLTCLVIKDPDALVEVPCPHCDDTILVERGSTP